MCVCVCVCAFCRGQPFTTVGSAILEVVTFWLSRGSLHRHSSPPSSRVSVVRLVGSVPDGGDDPILRTGRLSLSRGSLGVAGGAGGVGRILHISCKMEKAPSASL